MKCKRECGNCKHYVPLSHNPELGHCDKDDMIPYYSIDDKCDYREPYGFEPKDGEQE